MSDAFLEQIRTLAQFPIFQTLSTTKMYNGKVRRVDNDQKDPLNNNKLGFDM